MRKTAIFVLGLAISCSLAALPAAAVAAYDGGDVCVTTQRLSGVDRYGTAVAVSEAAFPGWEGVRTLVVASGEDASISDALAASALSGAMDAPLLLVRRDGVPAPVRSALQAIASREPTVAVVVVGGPGSVSDACVRAIRTELGSSAETTRVFGPDRYATAAAVASLVASRDTSSSPAMVLVANGEPSKGLVDALAGSGVAASARAPMLYVARDSVPEATRSALESLSASQVVVLGGEGVVSDATARAVGATERWWGSNRYGTAAAIAREARERGIVDATSAVVARTVVDAVASAQLTARGGGPLVLVSATGVPQETAAWLSDPGAGISRVTLVGGEGAVPRAVQSELEGRAHAPEFVVPVRNAPVGKKVVVTVRTGVNTRTVRLYGGTTLLAEKSAAPYSTVSFGTVASPNDGEALRAVAVSSRGSTGESAMRLRRLAYPAATSIVVDKSDFRLYWVKNDVLVKAYPIAIGRPGMETPVAIWKIGAKYYTDPQSVYGPRKMRLFRRVVSGDSVRYVYTAYGIHGTNQPWVIGTKASHGCIRMYNKDVLELFPQVPLGTLVQTRE
ncbi:MAG: cell wall-binding repeat-containing protein [Anaerosomatales bacterium]|nr:cell wall-binding repeat-containing protein [Anaerosomatales bacterium]